MNLPIDGDPRLCIPTKDPSLGRNAVNFHKTPKLSIQYLYI